MLTYLENTKDGFKEVSAADILNGNRPFCLFLGGLLHVNKIGIGSTLSAILNTLTETGNDHVPTYVSTLSSPPNVGLSAHKMYDYENNGALTEEAQALVEDILLPRPLLLEAERQGNIESLRRHLGRINIIGYSYGTSLVQQAEEIVLETLKAKNIEMHEIACAMNALAAINIGPVSRPLVWTREGHTDRFNRAANPAQANGLFTQCFFLRMFDKISQDVLGTKLIGNLPNEEPISLFGTADSVFICDNTGDEWMRRIGFERLSSGAEFPFITHQMDHEGHDLRVYTNTLHTTELCATFPSTGTAAYLNETCRQMVRESSGVSQGKPRTFLRSVDGLKDEAMVLALDNSIRTLHQNFDLVTKRYSRSRLQDVMSLVKSEIEQAAMLSARAPSLGNYFHRDPE